MPEPILLTEHTPAAATLSYQDADLLRQHFERQLPILPIGDQYWLQPHQYVGLIPLSGGRLIEIRPKVPVGAIFAMLAQVYDLADFGGQPQRYESVADLFRFISAQFVAKVKALVRHGLLRGYRTTEQESPSIRGKLRLAETFRRSPTVLHLQHHSEIADLSVDIAENRLLKLACERLAALDGLSHPSLRHLLQSFGEVTTVRPESLTISSHRGNRHYEPALALARLLLDHLSPGGAYAGQSAPTLPAFLIDMNRLFEGYITAILENSQKNHKSNDSLLPFPLTQTALGDKVNAAFSLLRQQSYPLDREGQVIVRPDVVIYAGQSDQPLLAVDAKYKREEANTDLYQAIAYCHALGIRRSILVYPASGDRTVKRYQIRADSGSDAIDVLLLPLDLSGDPADMARQAQTLVVMVNETINL